MTGVFVSYAREDAAKAQAIARALEQASFNVWFDQRMHSGAEYSREIEQALKDASAVVVLWSRHSVESAWVRDEAAEGRDSGRLVPVLIDDVRPPMGFRQFQTTDLSRWSGRGKPRQIEDVVAAVGAKAESTPDLARATVMHLPKPRPIRWIAGAVGLIIVAAMTLWFLRPVHEPTATPSVAVLPFVADASDPDGRKLASATRDAVAHTLSSGAFSVSTVDTLSSDKKAPADYIISGQVTGTPDKAMTTVRMQETAHNVVVFSHQFEAPRTQAWDLPDRVGAQVASQLSWTAPLIAMDARHPSDPAVLKSLLQSNTAGLRSGDSLQDYETARRIAAKAPNSPLAQNQLAFDTAFALDLLPREQRADAVATARRAADLTVTLAPEFGSGYVPWCLLRSEQRMAQCETRLRNAIRTDPDDPFANWFLSKLLNDVGRNREAAELASLSLAHDRYMPYKIGHAVRMLEVTGQSADAERLYVQSKRWWPKEEVLYWNRFVGFAQRADFQSIERLDREIQLETGVSTQPVLALASAVKSRSETGVKNACAARNLESSQLALCMLAFADIGDFDQAYKLADALYPPRRGPTAADEDRIWLDNPRPTPTVFITGPGAAAMRKDQRYAALADRLGLAQYWRSIRLPDFCGGKPEPFCAQLSRR